MDRFLVHAFNNLGALDLILNAVEKDSISKDDIIDDFENLFLLFNTRTDHIEDPRPEEYHSEEQWIAADAFSMMVRLGIYSEDGELHHPELENNPKSISHLIWNNYLFGDCQVMESLYAVMNAIKENPNQSAQCCPGLLPIEFLRFLFSIKEDNSHNTETIANSILEFRTNSLIELSLNHEESRLVISETSSLIALEGNPEIAKYFQPTLCSMMILVQSQLVRLGGLMESTQYITPVDFEDADDDDE